MRRFALLFFPVLLTALISSRLCAQVAVTVTSNVNAQPFTVTGTNCSAGSYTVPYTLQWAPGVSCTVAFSSPYAAQPDTRYLFSAWQDMDTSNPRTFAAPPRSTTLTATFTTQYYLTVQADPAQGGTATGEGWYDAGSQATISAAPAIEYQFIGWSPGGTGNPASIVVNFPQEAVADFRPITTPSPNHYNVTALADGGYLYGQNLMNDYGQVVGEVSDAFLWTPSNPNGILGTLEDLQTQNWGIAINSLGQLATGSSNGLTLWMPTTPNATTFTRSNIPLGPVYVASLNAFGQVAGSFNIKPGIWTPDSPNGTTGTLTLNAQFNGVVAMNRFGQAIMNTNPGNSQSQGVLFTPSSPNSATGTFTPIPAPPGSAGITVVAINDNGTILGYSCPGASGQCLNQAFVWKPGSPNSNSGTITVIPTASGTWMYPTALNALGDVVGTIGYDLATVIPFLYSGGVVYDLTSIDPLFAGSSPQAINSSGQIIANVSGSGAGYTGYDGIILATPVPASPAAPPHAISVTIVSSSSGQPFTVTGTNCSAGAYTGQQQLEWTPGATCVVTFGSPYSTQLTKRSIFTAWQDGDSSNPRTFTAPAQATTYTANFATQYLITGHASIPGTGTVTGGGWYNENATATLTANPAPGYTFVQWESGTAGTTGQLSFTVSYAADPVADFAVTAAPGNYILTLVDQAGSRAYLNDYGQVAGSDDSSYTGSPYLWTPSTPNGTLGNLTAVSPPPSAGSWLDVWGLNDEGQILGMTQPNSDVQSVFLWTPQSPNSNEGTAAAISSLNTPFAVPFLNNFGEVVGNLDGGWGIWTPNAANGTTGTTTSNAMFAGAAGINSFGQMIINQPQSNGPTLPVLFTPSSPHSASGTFTAIPGLSGYSSINLVAINDNGTVAGYSCTQSSNSTFPCTMVVGSTVQGFIWTPDAANGTSGTTVPIPLSAGVVSIQPSAINNLADVVGTMTVPRWGTTVEVPFLYSKGALYDLSAVSKGSAVAINAAGQIVLNSGDAIYLATPGPATAAPPKNAVPVSISSSPEGQGFALTGTGCASGTYSTPQTLQWTPGANCVVYFQSPYSTSIQTRTVFAGWQDGDTANPRTLETPASASTYTANFATEYYLTVEPNIPAVGPIGGTGWYAANETTTVAATPVPGYTLLNWSVDFGTQSSPLVVKMDHPKTVVANYVPTANVAPGSYSITTVVANGAAAGMNAFGQVAGTVAGVPFLWTPDAANGTLGTLIDLADSATSSAPVGAVGINDIGQVVGLGARNIYGYEALFLWSPDSANASTGRLNQLPLYWMDDILYPPVSFNNYGQIGGFLNSPGAIWTPTAPNAPTGSLASNPGWTHLRALNGYGQGVISFYPGQTPVLFTPSTPNGSSGTFSQLPVLVSTQPGASAFATAISEEGTVAGYTTCGAGISCGYEGYVWKPDVPHATSGTLTLIPPLPAFSSVLPKAINANGDIAGDMASVPFLYRGGTLYVLTALTDFDPAASLVAINSAGEILFNTPTGAYLATPAANQQPPSNAVSVTIAANVAVSFSVSGDGCAAGIYSQPQTLQWTPGANCMVEFLSPDTTLDSRTVFNGWQDGNISNPRTFAAPSQMTAYTATFKTQVYIGAFLQPVEAGTVAGAGWYDQNSTVTLIATPASGFAFLKWTSGSASFSENPLTVTASAPQTFTAMFTTVTTPVRGNYSVTLIAQGGTGIGINDFGQVAGNFGYYGTFLWTPLSANSVLGSLDTIPGMDTIGGLNSMGQVAGFSGHTQGGLLWSPAVPNTGTGSVASITSSFYGYISALNDFGQVAGYWSGGFSIWTPDHANGSTGSTTSDALFSGLIAMNAYGQAIMNGGSTSKTDPTWVPLLFTPSSANGGTGTFTSVTGPDGFVEVTLQAIGPDGTILGYGCVPLEGFCLNQGFFWVPDAANASTGNAMSIPMPANIASMTPVAMNARRDLIGTMQEASGGVVPFLYEQGVVYDLTPSVDHGTLVAINNAGQVLFNATGERLCSDASPNLKLTEEK